MGTRHLICVQHEGKYKVAQYGQWDGYPSGQGLTVLNFLREQFDREKFLARLAYTFEPSAEQIKEYNDRLQASGKTINDLFPSLSRDTGAKILDLIQNSTEPLPLRLSVEFAADSLFCEWAYVVDLDKNTLEAFQGFSKTPLAEGERFYGMKNDDPHANREYHPVKLAASWPLDALPDNAAFLSKLEPENSDEDEEEAAE